MRAVMNLGAALAMSLGLGLALSACSTREVKPAGPEMERVEAALAEQPCVGALSQWQRIYYYHPKYFGDEVALAAKESRAPRSSGHVRTLIGIELWPKGEGLADPAERISLGEPPYHANGAKPPVRGEFDIRDGRLTMVGCGE